MSDQTAPEPGSHWLSRKTGQRYEAGETQGSGGFADVHLRNITSGRTHTVKLENLRRKYEETGREIHPSHDPEPNGVRLYSGGHTCRRCCRFVAHEGSTYKVTDAGAGPCRPASVALRKENDE